VYKTYVEVSEDKIHAFMLEYMREHVSPSIKDVKVLEVCFSPMEAKAQIGVVYDFMESVEAPK
jgi:hypothetical protein